MTEYQLPENASWYNRSKGVYRLNIEPFTDEWHEYRKNGIGGSDIGRLLGLSDWDGASVLELFYEKIGLKPTQKDDNKYTFMGRYLEETVADLWRYYDGTDMGVIRNFSAGKKVRECRNLNGFLFNVKYPHLYVNIDRLIQKGAFKLTDGTALEDNAVLECKTASSWVARKWEDGVPPIYVTQAVQQCMILGVEYAEIAVLELDNRQLKVYPVEPSDATIQTISDHSEHFWTTMVVPAKKLVKMQAMELARGNVSEAQKIQQQIEMLEPAHDGSESYKSFMNQRWLSEPQVIRADDHMVENVKKLVLVKDIMKLLEEQKTYHENGVREFMREADTMETPYGKVTWKTGAKARTMLTSNFKFDRDAYVGKAMKLIDEIKESMI